MYTGPKLHNDNLAFGYDTGYGLDQGSSTRHYKGEPATNLITAGLPGYFGSGGETLYRNNYYGLNSDSGVFQRNFVNNPALANSSTYNNNAGLYKNFTTSALSSNTEYILISFDFYMIENYVRHSSSGTGLNGYLRVIYTDGSGDNLGWNTSLNTPNAGDDWNNNSAYIGQWRKIALYVQVNSSKTPSSINAMYIYNDRTIKGEGVFTNFIITEHVTVPTAPVLYTSSTRSNTQSLIDLKGTNDITVANVSFDSTGQPTLDGTDDEIDITFPTLSSNLGSIEVIVARKDTTTNSFIFGAVGGSTNRYYLRHAGSTSYDACRGNPLANASFGTLTQDKFYHLVMTWNNNTIYAYTNGELINSSSYTNPGTDITSGNIGQGSGNHVMADLPVFKIHNKTLSATEIKDNFNAYKNRFNI